MTRLLGNFRIAIPATSIGALLLCAGCGSMGEEQISGLAVPETKSKATPAQTATIAKPPTAATTNLEVSPNSISNSDPTKLPLIQASDFTYLGAFASPEYSGYTGRALAIAKNSDSGELSLFYRGHDQSSDQVAQISIPKTLSKSKIFDDLPKSRFIQPWANVTEGSLDTHPTGIGDAGGNGAYIYGLLSYQSKLLISASTAYSYNQTAALGTSGLDLSQQRDFRGFYALKGKVAIQRAMGGPMTIIPDEWQKKLGGKALVGNANTSIISANSFGPAMTILDPENLGSTNEAETLVFYPQSNPLCGSAGCESTLNGTYTWASPYNGRAFPKGTRTILAIGTHPTGEMWYGGPVSPTGTKAFCNDGGWGQKASDSESRVLAYDANDLLAVKMGKKKTWEVKPYANWRLPDIERRYCWDLTAAAFDNESGKLFITVRDSPYQNKGSRIEVYHVGK